MLSTVSLSWLLGRGGEDLQQTPGVTAESVFPVTRRGESRGKAAGVVRVHQTLPATRGKTRNRKSENSQMRVQDINGHWYEVDDALLAKCEVKMDRESALAEPLTAATTAGMRSGASLAGPDEGSTPAQRSTDSSSC
jgi:hypothetical protein